MKLKSNVFFTISVTADIHFEHHAVEVVDGVWEISSWEDFYTFSQELRNSLSELIED